MTSSTLSVNTGERLGREFDFLSREKKFIKLVGAESAILGPSFEQAAGYASARMASGWNMERAVAFNVLTRMY